MSETQKEITAPCLEVFKVDSSDASLNNVLCDEDRKPNGLAYETAKSVEVLKSVTKQGCEAAQDACPNPISFESVFENEQVQGEFIAYVKKNRPALLQLLKDSKNVCGFINAMGRIKYFADNAMARKKLEQFILHAQKNQPEQDICQNCRAAICRVLNQIPGNFTEESLPKLWFGDQLFKDIVKSPDK